MIDLCFTELKAKKGEFVISPSIIPVIRRAVKDGPGVWKSLSSREALHEWNAAASWNPLKGKGL